MEGFTTRIIEAYGYEEDDDSATIVRNFCRASNRIIIDDHKLLFYDDTELKLSFSYCELNVLIALAYGELVAEQRAKIDFKPDPLNYIRNIFNKSKMQQYELAFTETLISVFFDLRSDKLQMFKTELDNIDICN